MTRLFLIGSSALRRTPESEIHDRIAKADERFNIAGVMIDDAQSDEVGRHDNRRMTLVRNAPTLQVMFLPFLFVMHLCIMGVHS